jgi:hypothetical protein
MKQMAQTATLAVPEMQGCCDNIIVIQPVAFASTGREVRH